MNKRQEEIIKLILVDVALKNGGEIVIPLARLEQMENMQFMIDDNSDGSGAVRIILLPPEVVAGMQAAREEKQMEIEDRRKRDEEMRLERQAKIDAKNRDELRLLKDAEQHGTQLDPLANTIKYNRMLPSDLWQQFLEDARNAK